MIQRIGLLLLMLPLFSLALVVFAPSAPEAAAQNAGQRRDEGVDGGGRGERRSRRGFFRRDGGGEGNNERGGGRGGENPGGERLQRPNGSASTNRSDRPSGGAGSNISMEEYVRDMVKKHDKDGDMMLNADEQRGLSGKATTADLNKDGKITTNELSTTLSGNAPADAPAAASATGGDANASSGEDSENGERGGRGERRRGRERIGGQGEPTRGGAGGAAATRVYTALAASGKGGSSKAEDAETQRTYRFTRGADRLPATGLPSWFKSRDANGDGQVAMSEYSRSWSDRTVSEFRRYDLDNDGIVTSKEAAGK
jgi:hypothetical protein